MSYLFQEFLRQKTCVFASMKSELDPNHFHDSHDPWRDDPSLFGFRVEKSYAYVGESAVLGSFAHWWRYGWDDATRRYKDLGWYDRKYTPDKWERDLPDLKRFIAKFAFKQVQLEIPSYISRDGARGALLTIVPSLPDVQIAETIMNNRIGEAILFGFKPHEELFQRVFWNSFRQLTPHSDVHKVLPALYD